MPDPRKLPKEVHKARGTYREGRHAGPDTMIQKPLEMPEGMSDNCQRLWVSFVGHLDDLGLNNSVDQAAIHLLVTSVDLWQQASESIRENGLFVTKATRDGDNISAHPAVGIQEKAFKQILTLLKEFGLTAVARTNPLLIPGKSASPDILSILSPHKN